MNFHHLSEIKTETFIRATYFLALMVTNAVSLLSKIQGAILGYAIGDSLGMINEFSKKPKIVTDFETNFSKCLTKGTYTDDTQHLLFTIDSFLEYNY